MQKSLLKVVVLGDAGVGKTSLIRQFVEKTFSKEYKPTIGADFLTQDVTVNGKTITIQIWDTAGQERFKSMAVSFYRGSDAVMVTYDITDSNSFENVDTWMKEFCENAGKEIDEKEFPFILLGNKSDLADTQRAVPKDRAEEWCKGKNGMPFYETSAVNRQNLQEAFERVAILACNLDTSRPIPEIATSAVAPPREASWGDSEIHSQGGRVVLEDSDDDELMESGDCCGGVKAELREMLS